MFKKTVSILAMIGALASTASLASYPDLTADSDIFHQFVVIPDGFLPDGTRVFSFEAAKYPVTQMTWEQVMGSLPEGLQRAISTHKADWDNPKFPVTYVSYEAIQDFLNKLNAKAKELGQTCEYKLPSSDQLHYMIRADREGTNTDAYSTGVTDWNVNDYVNHAHWPFPWFQSHMQEVGKVLPNAFGIEMGNVWKVTSTDASWWPGHVTRGGSFGQIAEFAESEHAAALSYTDTKYNGTKVPGTSGWTGFQLIRICSK